MMGKTASLPQRVISGLLIMPLVLCLGLVAGATRQLQNIPPLTVNATSGKFKLVQFADLHWANGNASDCRDLTAEQQQYPCSDLNTSAFMAAVLDAEAPVDLVVFTGDNIMSDARDSRQAMSAAVQAVVARGIPWAAALGNHDTQAPIHNQTELEDYISRMPLSRSATGPADLSTPQRPVGGNFVLTIAHAHLGEGDAATLYFLDSGDYSKVPGVSGYDWVHQAQLEWWQGQAVAARNKSSALLPPRPPPPALMFFHIPVPEYNDMLAAGVPLTGDHQEGVSCPEVNSGLLETLIEDGTVLATVVGHDHVNDFCGSWRGMKLCYGGGTGFHAYGKAGWPRRARVFEIATSSGGDGIATTQTVLTWKRLHGTLAVKDVEYLLPTTPVPTDITVISGSTADVPCPPRYQGGRVGDLNKGVGGEYVFFCTAGLNLTQYTPATPLLRDIRAVLGNISACPDGWLGMDKKNSGNVSVSICASLGPALPQLPSKDGDAPPKSTSVVVLGVTYTTGGAPCPPSYTRDVVNMDSGHGAGVSAFLCVLRGPSPLPAVSTRYAWSTPSPQHPLPRKDYGPSRCLAPAAGPGCSFQSRPDGMRWQPWGPREEKG